MAKAWKVRGTDPKKSFLANAQVVLPTRLAELYSWESLIVDPKNVRDLHNMRISAKRLRYSMELYRACFDKNYEQYLDTVKTIQELLGQIHDCDVMADFLNDYVIRLGKRRRARANRVERRRHRVVPMPEQMAFAFVTALDDERPIRRLIAARRRLRTRLFKKFLVLWENLKGSDFQGRLLKLIRQAGVRIVSVAPGEATRERSPGDAGATRRRALIAVSMR